jgi:hypothetical protein
MRLLHYPPQHPSDVEANDRVIGIGAHTEYVLVLLSLIFDIVKVVSQLRSKCVAVQEYCGSVDLHLRYIYTVFHDTLARRCRSSSSPEYQWKMDRCRAHSWDIGSQVGL